MNLGHLMIDLETLGNEYGSVICSIGAVEFDIKTNKLGRSFYEKANIQSCLDLGLTINGSTIEWWLQQSEEARKEIYGGERKDIIEVLYLFRVFLEKLGTENLQIWGNSNRFDLGILESAYRSNHYQTPWKYTMERDVRTLVSFAPEIKESCPKLGIAHKPIDDCKFQISYCCQIWKKLNHE